MIKIDGALKNHIQKIERYDAEDNRLPTAVCCSCKIIVYRSLKDKTAVTLKLPDYSKFKLINHNTRSKNGKLCDCDVYNLVRIPGHSNFF